MNQTTHTPQSVLQIQKQLHTYKHNMKIFMYKVQQEVASLILNYQTQISHLLKQNQQLKQQLNGHRVHDYDGLFQNAGQEPLSPIKKIGSKITNQMSTMYITPQKFPSIKPMFDFKHNFSMNSNFQDLSRSRFEIQKNRNKQKQQQLLQSLQSGRNNLDLNTDKMFKILGKEKNINNQQEEEDIDEEGVQSARNASDPLNTSLSSLCSSLDKSFYAKKSRQKNNKKRQRQEKQRNEKLERLKEGQRMRKQEGLKNLLKTMRQNVKTPGNKAVQVVNNSKLLTTGDQSPKKISSSKPKVMINPVPVDISKRNRNNTSMSEPKSILKQPSNILTKSIMMGNSAISFQC